MDPSPRRTFLPAALLLLVLALLAVLGGLAIKLNRTSTALQASEARVRQGRDRSAAEIAELRREVATLRKDNSAPSPPPSRPEVSPSTNTSVDITEYIEALPNYPDYRRRSLQEQILMRYGDLSSLHLPPDKLQRLQELLFDQQAAPGDAQSAAQKQGIPANSPQVSILMAQAGQEIDKEVRDLLGKAGYAELQAGQQKAQTLAAVQNDLGLKMAMSSDPLSTDQAKAVADLLAQFHQHPYMPSALPADQELALQARATQLLTPRQLAAFQESRALHLQRAELQRQGIESAKKSLGQEIKSWSMRGP